MKLRTSYFNGTVLRKDITRFAPVWGLYTIFLILTLLLFQEDSNPARFASNMVSLMSGTVWINLLYAGLCANLLFGDLFQSRMCNAMHAMPMRREGWFLTHTAAGILFAAIPDLLAAALSAFLLQEYFYIGLIWLAVSLLQYLFFFGAAAFSTLCAGNRLAMAAIYGLLNFLAVLGYWAAELLYMPLLYGIQLDSTPFAFLCPSIWITEHDYVLFDYDKILGGIWGGFVAESWQYLAGLAILGLALLVLAMLLYRRRQLECAGDFISLKPIRAVFLVIYSVLAGFLIYALYEALGNISTYLMLGVGLLIGFFTGKMLLDRTVRVFNRKNWLGFALLTGAMAASLLLTWLDPMGLARYIPETGQIQSVRIHSSNDDFFIYSTPNGALEYTEDSQIDSVRDLHRQILEHRATGDYARLCSVEMTYTLTDGSTVNRYYTLPREEALAQSVQALLTSPEYILQTWDWDATVASFNMVELDLYSMEKFGETVAADNSLFHITEPEAIRQLMDAVYQDCLAGNMAQEWYFHQEEDVIASLWIGIPYTDNGNRYASFEIQEEPYYSQWYRDLSIYSGCTHTMEFLESYLSGTENIS